MTIDEHDDLPTDEAYEARLGLHADLEAVPPTLPELEALPVLDAGSEPEPEPAPPPAPPAKTLADVLAGFGTGHPVRNLTTGEVLMCTDIDLPTSQIRVKDSTAWRPASEWAPEPGWEHVPEKAPESEGA